MGLRRTLLHLSTPFRIFLNPFQNRHFGEQEPLADLDSGEIIKPDQVLDDVVVILSLTNLRDTEKLNQFLLSH